MAAVGRERRRSLKVTFSITLCPRSFLHELDSNTQQQQQQQDRTRHRHQPHHCSQPGCHPRPMEGDEDFARLSVDERLNHKVNSREMGIHRKAVGDKLMHAAVHSLQNWKARVSAYTELIVSPPGSLRDVLLCSLQDTLMIHVQEHHR